MFPLNYFPRKKLGGLFMRNLQTSNLQVLQQDELETVSAGGVGGAIAGAIAGGIVAVGVCTYKAIQGETVTAKTLGTAVLYCGATGAMAGGLLSPF